MTSEHQDPSLSRDDLAAFALDAHDAPDAAAIAERLASRSADNRIERDLRLAAGEFAAAVVEPTEPPSSLRDRVVAAARQRRAPAAVVAGWSAIDVHRVEAARAIVLLRDLTVEDWARPVDPGELAGWTVHDVAMHLAATEAMLASALGVPLPGVPDTATDNVGRTTQARARLGARSPASAVAEFERAAQVNAAEVVRRGEARLRDLVDFWGRPLATSFVLVFRAFEIWTHADDIRRAIGAAMAPPPQASLLTMAHFACGIVSSTLAARGFDHSGRFVRFRFEDLGPTAWDVDLGSPRGVRPAGSVAVDAEIATDALSFCRRISGRIPAGDLRHEVIGDRLLVRDIIDALPALAVL